VEYEYSNDEWVSQIKVSKGGTEIFKQEYGYDSLGRRTSVKYPRYLVSGNTSLAERGYTYDKRDEVTKVAIDGSARYNYGYDLNQNPTRRETPYGVSSGNTNTTVAVDYDHVSEIRYGDGRKIRLTMDTAGNIGQKVRVSSAGVTVETTEYRYTYHNQLAEVWRNGEKIQANQYDEDRQRVSVEDGINGRKWLYWDPAGRIVGEGREGVADVVVKYIYDGNEKVAMVRPDNTGTEKGYYFINDANGTPLMIMDETGKVVSRINMDDWGNVNKYRVGAQAEINYTGKKLDTATGLYYFNQRYYDPEIGRFIQEDLAQEYLNPYVYVGNNVANLIDPDGLASMEGSSMPQPSYPSPVTEAWLLGAGGSGGMSSGSFGSIDIGMRRQGLPNAVQGPMTGGEKQSGLEMLARLYSHFQVGNKSEYHVDASKLDFSGTTQGQLGLEGMKVGELQGVNLFKAGINSNSLAFGKVDFVYKGNDQFAIQHNAFDFNIEWDKGVTWRNAGTVLGAAINYSVLSAFLGGPYDVIFDGTATIPK